MYLLDNNTQGMDTTAPLKMVYAIWPSMLSDKTIIGAVEEHAYLHHGKQVQE